MIDMNKIDLVIAGIGPDGREAFLPAPAPGRYQVPGAVDASFLWETDATPRVPTDAGKVPGSFSFPPVNGSRFSISCFPAHSAGKLNVAEMVDVDEADAHDKGMHISDTLDYEVILSGRIDIVLPRGLRRTLGPGSCVIMKGVLHSWENIYDEDCYYAAITIGAVRA